MGIKDFNKLFRELAPNAYRTVPLGSFKGHRIAIDGHNWMYSRISTIQRDHLTDEAIRTGELDRGALTISWIDACLNFNLTLIAYGITPLWVFDGKHPPEKSKTKKKRYDKKKKADEKLQEYRAYISGLQGAEQLNVNGKMLGEMKSLMEQSVRIYGDEQEMLRSTLEGVGIPCFRAHGEAEQLCSMFCLDGLASAVFSTDTDNFAYGAPLVITGLSKVPAFDPETGHRTHSCECVHLPSLVSEAKFPFETFRELCITLGCDYNDNIAGVGPKTAHKSFRFLTDTYGRGNIECLSPKYNIESLNRERCRWLFMYRPFHEVLGETDEVLSPLSPEFEEKLCVKEVDVRCQAVLESIGLSRWLGKLVQHVPALPRPQRVEPDPLAKEIKTIRAIDPSPPPSRLRLRILQPVQQERSSPVKIEETPPINLEEWLLQ